MKTYLKLTIIIATILSLVIIIKQIPQPAYAAGTWYVTPSGNNSNDCLSSTTPCATINDTLNKPGFVPGDTILIATGTYTGTGDQVVLLDKDVILLGGWNNAFNTQTGHSTIDGEDIRLGIKINNFITAEIERFAVHNGPPSEGYGILNEGVLTFNDGTVTNNLDHGIFNDNGRMILNNSTVSDNLIGIYNGGMMTVTNSIITNNSIGLLNGFSQNLIVNNSIISENSGQCCAGISNAGNLILNNSIVSNNVAEYEGGGISNSRMMTISNSLVTGNLAREGAGIYNSRYLILNNSAVNENVADLNGGGVFNVGYSLNLNNSTISGNIAVNGGGIFRWSGFATLNNSTVSNNIATADPKSSRGGGGFYSYPDYDSMTLKNSIVANNISGTGPDCAGIFYSAGYNLIRDTTDCTFTVASGDLTSIEPKLFLLTGSPGYHPLLYGSPAINAGNPAGCTDHLDTPLTTDQRGIARIGRCDIGAYEFDPNNNPLSYAFLPITTNNYCPDFFDDFSDPASGWLVVNDNFVRSEYLNGEYRTLSKQSGFIFYFRAPTCQRENYVVETDARWVGAPGSSYGLIFGIRDTANEFFDQFYLFDINTDFQQFRLLRLNSDDTYTVIVPPTGSSAILAGNVSNHLKTTRNGNLITLEVNGTVLGSWTDGAITGMTDAGLIFGPYDDNPTSDVRFDNFTMASLPSSSTSVFRVNGTNLRTGIEFRAGSENIIMPTDIQWSNQQHEAKP